MTFNPTFETYAWAYIVIGMMINVLPFLLKLPENLSSLTTPDGNPIKPYQIVWVSFLLTLVWPLSMFIRLTLKKR